MMSIITAREQIGKLLEEFQRATKKLEDALSINMKMRGDLAIDTIVNQELLADVYVAVAQELYDKASSRYTIAKKMAENLLGKNCKQVQRIREKCKRTIEQQSNLNLCVSW